MKHKTILISLLTSAAILSGCAPTQPALSNGTDNFGAAIAHNISAQAIAPSEAQKANTHIPANPKRRAAARENYENGTTPDPKTTETRN